jgi:dolichol-phosphate mannosyltransferase
MRVVHRLSDQGFKILLDILASARPPMKITEVPFEFRNREHGESKLDTAVAWQYAELVLDKLVGRWVPVRMIKFAAVGTLGLVVHFATLFAAKGLGQPFLWSQLAATFVAMTWNYYLNNLFTFRDQRSACTRGRSSRTCC